MAFTFYYDTDEAGKSKIGYRNGRGLARLPDLEALDSGMNGEWVPGMAVIFDLDEFGSNQYWSGLAWVSGSSGALGRNPGAFAGNPGGSLQDGISLFLWLVFTGLGIRKCGGRVFALWWQQRPDLPVFLDVAEEPGVERVPAQGTGIAYDDELHPRSCHGHVHAPQVAQETDPALFVGTDQADQDDVAFLALEAVYRMYRE